MPVSVSNGGTRRKFPSGLFDLHLVRGYGLQWERDEACADRVLLTPRWQVRTQDELAVEIARFETAVCLGDLIKRDALCDPWPDRARLQ